MGGLILIFRPPGGPGKIDEEERPRILGVELPPRQCLGGGGVN